MKVQELKDFVRSGGYAWPGGYPCALLMADGECIDVQACKENYRLIRRNLRDGTAKDWTPVAVFINWEDVDLYCAHSGRQIQYAYGD